MGTMVAPLRSASVAIPSLAVWSSPVGLRVPSANISSTPPASRTLSAVRKPSTSAAPRSMPCTPPRRPAQPTTGHSSTSRFANQWTRRPSGRVMYAPMSTGSRLEAWFGARITGPLRGQPVQVVEPDAHERLEDDPATPRERADEPGVALLGWIGLRGERRPAPRGRSTALVPGARAVRAVVAVRAAHRAGALARRSSAAWIASIDELDRLLPGVAVRREMQRVIGGAERGDGPAGVGGVAASQIGQDHLRLVARRVQAALLGPPSRPLLRGGVEIQLEVRIRQHDGADVAPGHHDPAGVGEGPLPLAAGPRGPRGRRPRTRPVVDRGRMGRSVASSPSSRTREAGHAVVGPGRRGRESATSGPGSSGEWPSASARYVSAR